jgi:hypothetical protein
MPETLTIAKQRNIFQLAAPFHYVTKAFGLGCFQLRSANEHFKVKVYHRIWLTINVMFWLLVSFYCVLILAFDQTNRPRATESSFLSSIYFDIVVIQIFVSAVIIVFDCTQRHHAYQFLASLHEFDEEIKKLQWPHALDGNSSFGYLMITLAYISSCFAFYMGIDMFQSSSTILILILAYNNMIYVVVVCQFILSVVCVTNRMQILSSNFG